MDLTLTGLIASLIVFVIIFGMLGLIFNATLNVLNQQKEYAEFYADVQNLTNTIDMFLSQSVWKTEELEATNNYLILPFFVPQQSSLSAVIEKKKLKIENGKLIFSDYNDSNGKIIMNIPNTIGSARFAKGIINSKKFIIMMVQPKNAKLQEALKKQFQTPLKQILEDPNQYLSGSYPIFLLSALTEAG
ncbi:hypothetical protein [Fervidobacterium nodosum]|uniref:Uncharacterized protein n=1 Tax=Fervidobacterium nodosum (strain ATCC 35602 / DSM 5306 / Rt17-B1) TaxID=381764 RepID=A7HLY6_FERNB|nr:hypothetical protein [Fervidobacterium nodosum]ABS60919.1 hypothetical protein Fnod_1071 [Fervidobacterium nodosum Rt17-B1]